MKTVDSPYQVALYNYKLLLFTLIHKLNYFPLLGRPNKFKNGQLSKSRQVTKLGSHSFAFTRTEKCLTIKLPGLFPKKVVARRIIFNFPIQFNSNRSFLLVCSGWLAIQFHIA